MYYRQATLTFYIFSSFGDINMKFQQVSPHTYVPYTFSLILFIQLS